MTLRSITQRHLHGVGLPAVSLPARRPAFIETLAIPSFRQLWISNGISLTGKFIQSMTIAWLVLEMTGSNLWVGIVNGVPAISVILFSLLGGVLSDRMDRRRLLIWSRITLASLSFLAAVLAASGTIELWQLMLIVMLIVGLYAVDEPVGRTLTLDIVGRGHLLSATSMTTMVRNFGTVIGPSIIGILIAKFGVHAALYLLAGGYYIAFILLFFVKGGERKGTARKSSILREMAEGIAYIARTPSVRWLIGLSATLPIAGVFFGMLPVYARDELQVGAEGLGMLVAAYGFGCMIGSMYLSIRGGVSRKGLVITIASIVYSAGMIAFALSPDLQTALVVGFITGVAAMFWMNNVTVMVQTAAADEMRGRVMSIFGIFVQLYALGWLIGAVLASAFGNQWAMIIAGSVFAPIGVFAYIKSKELRNID